MPTRSELQGRRGSSAARGEHTRRGDIQGLRAVAVLLVVVYHVWPQVLPGGFVGVDVFFVISGYLIIGLLFREVERTGSVDLVGFYARRIRRLLPAAAVTLLAVSAATAVVLPLSLREGVLREAVASALNVQNWALAFFSTGYAHATSAASPLQHFWSLSVEEQFYLLVPLVLLTTGVVAARRGLGSRRLGLAAVAVLTAASFLFSVWFTGGHRELAYFVTPTRMWEMGVGGLVAVALSRRAAGGGAAAQRVRGALAWLGLAAVALSALLITTQSAFPGWVGAFPVLGAAVLLGTGSARSGSPTVSRWLSSGPLRWVGDISYSLYLWHWPVIVLAMALIGGSELSPVSGTVCVGLSFVLAAVSKRFVEDPFRNAAPTSLDGSASRTRRTSAIRARRATLRLGVLLTVTNVAFAGVAWAAAHGQTSMLADAVANGKAYPGARALDPASPAEVPSGLPFRPDPAVAAMDVGPADTAECQEYDVYAHPASSATCTFGATSPGARLLVVVGDSHGQHLSGGLIQAASDAGWRVKLLTRNGCPFTMNPPDNGQVLLRDCSERNGLVLEQLVALHPDLVVTSNMSRVSYERDLHWTWPSADDMVDGYRKSLEPLRAAGIRVVAIADVPRPVDRVLTCLQRNPDAPDRCGQPLTQALPDPDPAVRAASSVGADTLDLTDRFCVEGQCQAVVGNVTVYRDSHLTATFSRSLSDSLRAGLHLDQAG